MSYTPGPWYLARLGAGSIVCSTRATLLPPTAGTRCVDVIARTDWGRGEEDEANAMLVVAAPDLVTAMRALLDMVTDNRTHGPEIDTALAALTKAEGRMP